MERELREQYKQDQIRRAWNAIALSGTTNPHKDYVYFQRINKTFLKK